MRWKPEWRFGVLFIERAFGVEGVREALILLPQLRDMCVFDLH
jgi:hypothetical protein